jgi:hypothetical protein
MKDDITWKVKRLEELLSWIQVNKRGQDKPLKRSLHLVEKAEEPSPLLEGGSDLQELVIPKETTTSERAIVEEVAPKEAIPEEAVPEEVAVAEEAIPSQVVEVSLPSSISPFKPPTISPFQRAPTIGEILEAVLNIQSGTRLILGRNITLTHLLKVVPKK